jgi:ATP-dependent Clp endopeptidase proteolytic subunit ClpP
MAQLREGRIDWYSIKNLAGPAPSVVSIYDEVGYFGVTAQDFIRDLSAIEGDIELHLSTPGGEIFDGIAIYGALKQRAGNVVVVVDSLAASIGSIIAMAASPGQLAMMPNASMMIHEGFGFCVGNAADMMETAALLDKTSGNLATIYAERSGKPAEEWRDAMKAETWYIGQEAVDAGLADKVLTKAAAPVSQPEPQSATATFDLSVFRRVPQALRNQVSEAPETPVPEPAPEPAPPPTPEAPPTEAPAETDRGFVVPGAGEPEPEVTPEPGAMPPVQANSGRPKRILGIESMPLLNKAIAVHHTATEDGAWDGPAAVAAMPAEYADLHYCHAWQSADADESSHTPGDDDEDDKKGAFKFPHHEKKGAPANLAACRNGKARLSGADIPDADRAGVEAHLQAHLDDAAGDDGASNHTHDNPGDAWSWDPDAFRKAMEGA